jgi:hypothetical protein
VSYMSHARSAHSTPHDRHPWRSARDDRESSLNVGPSYRRYGNDLHLVRRSRMDRSVPLGFSVCVPDVAPRSQHVAGGGSVAIGASPRCNDPGWPFANVSLTRVLGPCSVDTSSLPVLYGSRDTIPIDRLASLCRDKTPKLSAASYIWSTSFASGMFALFGGYGHERNEVICPSRDRDFDQSDLKSGLLTHTRKRTSCGKNTREGEYNR